MSRPTHYQPVIPLGICALYHEGKRRGLPMTRLIDELLAESLSGTPGWQAAADQYPCEMPTPNPASLALAPSQ